MAQFCSTTDEFLPKAILDATQFILSVVGSMLVAVVVNPYFLIPVLIIGVLFIFIRTIYLKTSRNVKRLEGIGAYRPMYEKICSHLSYNRI